MTKSVVAAGVVSAEAMPIDVTSYREIVSRNISAKNNLEKIKPVKMGTDSPHGSIRKSQTPNMVGFRFTEMAIFPKRCLHCTMGFWR